VRTHDTFGIVAVNGKIAVVSGANRGIGLAVCAELAALGVRVVLASRDVGNGRAAQRALKARGLDVDFQQLDVTDRSSVRALAAYTERTFGGVDIVVNNAGVMLDPPGSRAQDVNRDVLVATFEVNVYGAIALCQALVPSMLQKRYGRIVNVSSGMAQLREMGAGSPAYRLSKTTLNAYTRTLAAELQGSGILVNCASPGWCRTDMGGSAAPRSAVEGAQTIAWLATLPDGGPNGGFFRDRESLAW